MHSQIAQAYLGGALDAIAVVNEMANNDEQVIYCRSEKELFDMPEITKYVQAQKNRLADSNAIVPVIDYLRVHGHCKRG